MLTVLNNLGEAYLAWGRPDEAGTTFADAQAIAREIEDDFELGRACAGVGRVAAAHGDDERAAAQWSAALDAFDDSVPEALAVAPSLTPSGGEALREMPVRRRLSDQRSVGLDEDDVAVCAHGDAALIDAHPYLCGARRPS